MAATAALLVAAMPARAQTIGGRVLDDVTRHGAHPVKVQVLDDSGFVLAHTETDTTGVFYATLVHPARVRVHFEYGIGRSSDSDTMTVGADEFLQHEFLLPFIGAYLESHVDKQASMLPGSIAPRYPPALKAAGVSGGALVEFIVDSTGTARMSSFRVLSTTHPAFAEAVRAALPRARFRPAEVFGRPVAQLVQYPFSFSVPGARFPTASSTDSLPIDLRRTP